MKDKSKLAEGITLVTLFRTTDGKDHPSLEQAMLHAENIKNQNNLRDFLVEISGIRDGTIQLSFNDLADTLLKHKQAVIEILLGSSLTHIVNNYREALCLVKGYAGQQTGHDARKIYDALEEMLVSCIRLEVFIQQEAIAALNR